MGPEGRLGDLRVGRFPAGRDTRLMSKTYPLQCVEDHGGRLAFLLADQETRKPGNQENREPRNLEIRNPRSQGAREPGSQRTVVVVVQGLCRGNEGISEKKVAGFDFS